MDNKAWFKKEREAYNAVKEAHKKYELNPNNHNYEVMVKADSELKSVRMMMN